MKSASAIRRQVRALNKMRVFAETERLVILRTLDWVLGTAATAPPATQLEQMDEMAQAGRKVLKDSLRYLERSAK